MKVIEAKHVTVVPHGDLSELVNAFNDGFAIVGTANDHAGNIVYTMVKLAPGLVAAVAGS